MKIKNIIYYGALLCLSLTGCGGGGQPTAPGNYDAAEVGKINKVVSGLIVSKRPVVINSQIPDSGVPAANNVNAPTSGGVTRSAGFEYIVKLDTGAIISVVQAEDLRLKINQPILVIYGATTRIVPNGSVGNQ